MENSLKQRLVGAIVLVALAVIFLPSILKEKTKTEPFQSQIPPKPSELVAYDVTKSLNQETRTIQLELDEVEESARKQKQNVEGLTEAPMAKTVEKNAESNAETTTNVANPSKPASAGEQKASPQITPTKPAEAKTVAKSEPEKNTINSSFKTAAWLIQVASFTNKDNADKLVGKLKKAKFKAYQRPGKSNQGKNIYRIYVGPYIEKNKANKDLAKVSKISQSKGLVLVFDPEKH